MYATGTIPSAPMFSKFLVGNITSASFVVQWDEVDDADYYIVNWRDDGGSVRKSTTSQTSITITQLSPDTTYSVTVTAVNICGSGTASDILIVTTNVGLLVELSTSSSVMTTSSTMSSMVAMAIPTSSSSSSLITTSTIEDLSFHFSVISLTTSCPSCVCVPTQSQSGNIALLKCNVVSQECEWLKTPYLKGIAPISLSSSHPKWNGLNTCKRNRYHAL